MTAAPDHVTTVLAQLRARLDDDAQTNIGFPATLDLDYARLFPFFNMFLNNLGDPFVDSAYPRHTKDLEREVLTWFANLLRAPAGWWGVTTSGGTEGIEYGLVHARHRFPDALVLYSAAAHYSAERLPRHLRLPAVALRANHRGELELADLRDVIRAHRHLPLIIIATIGTTMTEAVDAVSDIRAALADYAVSQAWVHADAALSGLPLALLPPGSRPTFDLADGADSISISAHKFLGCPMAAGVYLTTRGSGGGSTVEYINTLDSTLAGSRSGHAPLLIWYAIQTLGLDGLRARAHESWQVAAHAVQALQAIGWNAWRHPHAMTVVLDTPPAELAAKWRLASSNGQSHIVTVPGVTTAKIDTLVAELSDLVPARLGRQHTRQWPAVPTPRSASYDEEPRSARH